MGGGENIIEHEFDELEGASFSAGVSWIADAVPADGDAGAVGFGFLRAHLAYHSGVGDVCSAVGRNVLEVDGSKGVRSVNSWF